MKFILAVVAFAGVVDRCSELPVDHPWHGHRPPPTAADEDAGMEDVTCGPPGLYADRACKRLAAGVIPYTPRFELWADGADKQRHIYLPEGTKIDTSIPDRWKFPVGTRIYKTFSLHGKKLETRVLTKLEEPAELNSWSYEAYAWDAEQRDATLVGPEGAQNVLDEEHDIPAREDCERCHDQGTLRATPTDIVNGFQAIQLNHDGRGWTLERLIAQERLQNVQGGAPNVTTDNARVPGTRVDHAALGYLHANCGHCHAGQSPRGGLNLSLVVDTTDLAETAAYQVAATCKLLARWTGRVNELSEPYVFVIDPGAAATSGVVGRMSVRARREQMPPLGTEQRDEVGLAGISRWIDGLELECDAQATAP